jgi:hypothetical protein
MKRIFLVGSPRSGTTLLQSLIGCSPDVITFKESHLFSRSFSTRHASLPAHRSPKAEVARFYEENGIDARHLPASLNMPARLSRDAVAAYFIEALDKAGETSGKKVWLEKTPRHLLYTDLIERAAARDGKQVHFVHLIRDGVSVAASISTASQLWQRQHDPMEALQRWQTEIAVTRNNSNKANHTVAVYEDLLRQPYATMLKLAQKLGISLTEKDLERRKDVLDSIVRTDESWKLDTADHDIKPMQRTAQHVSDDQKACLTSKVDYEDYNYLVKLARGANSGTPA